MNNFFCALYILAVAINQIIRLLHAFLNCLFMSLRLCSRMEILCDRVS